MAWRYTFDGGPEKPLECASTLYALAAMAAFAREEVTKMPTIKVPGKSPYKGHVLSLWDDKLVDYYPAHRYGIGFNQCGGITIPQVVG